MKHIMNIQKFNVKAAAAVAAAVAGLCGCSDWTRPEALDVAPEMQESSEETLAAIRAFKQTDHKIVVLGMDATAETPVGRYQHLNSMPDSADYIFIRNLVGGLHRDLVQEIGQVRKQKGTRVLADIDYISIEEEWLAIQDAAIDAGEPAGTDEEYTSFVTEKVNAQLACLAKYGCDGLMISYNGSASSSVAVVGRAAFINAVMAWRASSPDVEMLLRGNLQQVIRNTSAGETLYDVAAFLAEFRLIVFAVGEYTTENDVNSAVNRLRRSFADFPIDRFIFEATVPDPADPVQIGMTPQQTASYVLNLNEDFTKLGLCVENAEDDYFNIGNSYINVRRAITVLNTEPSVDENPSATEE